MYTTKELVEAKLGQYVELITAGMEEGDVEAFITEADNTIDGYLAAAVSLPFTTTPKLISSISTDISVRNLWAQKQAKSLPEHVKLDYDNAIKLLQSVAKGTIKLEAKDPGSADFHDLKYSGAPRLFGKTL
jgi:phage gp36-like protein